MKQKADCGEKSDTDLPLPHAMRRLSPYNEAAPGGKRSHEESLRGKKFSGNRMTENRRYEC